MFQDIRFAWRELAARPAYTFSIIATFALGLGATTATFSMVHSVLIATLPYAESDRVVRVFETLPDGYHNSVSGGVYKDWVAGQSSFEALAIYSEARMNLTGEGRPERLTGLRASANLLDVLRVTPEMGRGIGADEDQPGGNNNVVVIAHRFWQQRFNGDEDVLGRLLTLDGERYVIIGVLPPRALMDNEALFVIPEVIDGDPEAWQRYGHWRHVLGRLRSGVDIDTAISDLRAVKQRLAADYPSYKDKWSVDVVPLREVYAASMRPTIYLLFATAAFVLLIACTNVSNLLFARMSQRAQELAVRGALGASRSRILRQLLGESLLLAALGCISGLALAWAGMRVLAVMVTQMLPYALQPELDTSVFVFAFLLSGVCGLLFGLLPALHATRADIAVCLRDGERGAGSREKHRAQRSMLVFQFAFTLILLIGAGLLLRSFVSLLDVDPGFRAENVLAFDLSLPDRYASAESRVQFTRALRERIQREPGVEAVGVTGYAPLSGNGATEMLSRADRAFTPDYLIGLEPVSGEYFETMDIPLLRGRVLEERDNRADAPKVIVISSTVAEDLYPGEEALGQRVRLFRDSWEIVGVAAPVHHESLHAGPYPRAYISRIHSPMATTLVVRTSVPPGQMVEPMRRAVLDIDPDQPVANVRSMQQAVDEALASHRTTLTLLGIFASAAVVLASVGIYGVTAYAVSRRRREFGIRAALGADRRSILQLVMLEGLKPSLLGMLFGLAAAFALARFLESLLYAVNSHDAVVFAAAPVVLLAIAALAVLLPAARAARNEPMAALREE